MKTYPVYSRLDSELVEQQGSELRLKTNLIDDKNYKVYTALLTQSGGSNLVVLNSGLLTIGTTYWINECEGVDFTNVGAPNNDANTYFVATGTTPNSWGINEGIGDVLITNTGAPVATVLENTIGNIVWTYEFAGTYYANLTNAFPLNKVYVSILTTEEGISNSSNNIFHVSENMIAVYTLDNTSASVDGLLGVRGFGTPIEIRVYN